MKKLFVIALMAAATTSVFAQDAVKKAQSLLKSNDIKGAIEALQPALNTGTSTDKAAAWNALVDIQYQQFSDVYDEQTKNRALGKKDVPFDTAKINKASVEAVKAALECDKYDMQPNEKGKVKPKFRSKNVSRIIAARNYLLQAGNDAFNSRDYVTANESFGLYIDSKDAPMFAESKLDNSNVPTVAYYAMLAAYYAKNNKDVYKYSNAAMNDTADVANVIQITAAAYQADGDSVNYQKTLEMAHAKFPEASNYFEWLMNCYLTKNNTQLIKDFAAKEAQTHPNSKFSFYALGVAAEYDKNWDVAITNYKKAADLDPKYSSAVYNAARTLLLKANDIRNDTKLGNQANAKSLPYIKESIQYFEKTRELLPDRKDLWAYPLYNAYYAVGDKAKADEYEKMTKE